MIGVDDGPDKIGKGMNYRRKNVMRERQERDIYEEKYDEFCF